MEEREKMLDGGERTKATHTQGKEEGKKSNEKGRKYVLQKKLMIPINKSMMLTSEFPSSTSLYILNASLSCLLE